MQREATTFIERYRARVNFQAPRAQLQEGISNSRLLQFQQDWLEISCRRKAGLQRSIPALRVPELRDWRFGRALIFTTRWCVAHQTIRIRVLGAESTIEERQNLQTFLSALNEYMDIESDPNFESPEAFRDRLRREAIDKSLIAVPKDKLQTDLEPCSICGEEYYTSTEGGACHRPCMLSRCKHVFGGECIVAWLKDERRNTCLLCRAKVLSVLERN